VSIRYIELNCDIPRCWAFCRVERPTVDNVREVAAKRWGWSRTPDGGDQCGPCTRGDTPDARGGDQ
jgi:hypothetical protein